jgi:hypothetical protein
MYVGKPEMLERCSIDNDSCGHSVTVVCMHQSGLQAVLQQENSSEVLYFSQSTDQQTAVTLPVMSGGIYRISIFALRDGMGILNSSALYTTEIRIVSDECFTITTGMMGAKMKAWQALQYT